jgi:hypothetical protein
MRTQAETSPLLPPQNPPSALRGGTAGLKTTGEESSSEDEVAAPVTATWPPSNNAFDGEEDPPSSAGLINTHWNLVYMCAICEKKVSEVKITLAMFELGRKSEVF